MTKGHLCIQGDEELTLGKEGGINVAETWGMECAGREWEEGV